MVFTISIYYWISDVWVVRADGHADNASRAWNLGEFEKRLLAYCRQPDSPSSSLYRKVRKEKFSIFLFLLPNLSKRKLWNLRAPNGTHGGVRGRQAN